MTELPYEREAMQNNPMPDGLTLLDQLMYQNLALLYYRYHCGAITREQAKTAKGKLLFSYDRKQRADKVANDLAAWHAGLRKEVEGAQNAYMRARRSMENSPDDPSFTAAALDAADRMCAVIDGRLRNGMAENNTKV